jgi:hypothetical protein
MRKSVTGKIYAVAVRDACDLFLLARIRRSAKGDIYIVYARSEPKDFDPHTSYHASGHLHDKWFGFKFMVREGPRPDASFRGTLNLRRLSVDPKVPRANNIKCDPARFSEVFEIPVNEVRVGRSPTSISLDLTEPGVQPSFPLGAHVLRQAVFQDVEPWILVTVFEDPGPSDTRRITG